GDSLTYRYLAERLTQGSFPSIFRTPGYPLFLMLTGGFPQSSIVPTLLAQMILDSLTAVMLAAIAQRLAHDSVAALIAGLGWAFCTTAIVSSAWVMTETLTVFLIVAALYTALQPLSVKMALAQSLLWAAAVLTRPSAIAIPLIVTPLLVALNNQRVKQNKEQDGQPQDVEHPDAQRIESVKNYGWRIRGAAISGGGRRWRHQLQVLTVYAFLLSGWICANGVRTGWFGFSSLRDVSMYMYELPAVHMLDKLGWSGFTQVVPGLWLSGLYPNFESRMMFRKERKAFLNEVYKGHPPEGQFAGWFTAEDPTTARWLRAEAERRMRGKLTQRIQIHLYGAVLTMMPISYAPWLAQSISWISLDGLRLGLLLPLGFVILLWRRQWLFLTVAALWLAYTLLLPGVLGHWRHRCVAEPAITLVLAIGLAPLWSLIRQRLAMRGTMNSRRAAPA
ncbi:MAG: hypothetical protein M3347_05940, partial [Armatimonadota bacterium]|nr:hypothetical protein [Armatimonadota bacterium]